MSWRNFKPSMPIDTMDKSDKTLPDFLRGKFQKIIQPTSVDFVDKVDRDKCPEDAMAAILLKSRDRIIEACQGRQYHTNEQLKQAEFEIGRVWQMVLSGNADLEDFQSACENWESSTEANHEESARKDGHR